MLKKAWFGHGTVNNWACRLVWADMHAKFYRPAVLSFTNSLTKDPENNDNIINKKVCESDSLSGL